MLLKGEAEVRCEFERLDKDKSGYITKGKSKPKFRKNKSLLNFQRSSSAISVYDFFSRRAALSSLRIWRFPRRCRPGSSFQTISISFLKLHTTCSAPRQFTVGFTNPLAAGEAGNLSVYWFSGLLLLQMKEAARTLDALDVDQDGRVDNKIKQKNGEKGFRGRRAFW